MRPSRFGISIMTPMDPVNVPGLAKIMSAGEAI